MSVAFRIAGLAVVAAFWGWYFADNLHALAGFRWQLEARPVLLAIALWGIYFLLMAVGWVLAARSSGAKVGVRAGTGIWIASMPARYIPGNVWHVAGRLHLAAGAGVAAPITLASSVLEQVLTVMGELTIFLLLLPFWSGLSVPSPYGFLAALLFGLGALHPRVLGAGLRLAGHIIKRPSTITPPAYRALLFLLLWYAAAAFVNGLAFFLMSAAVLTPESTSLPLLAGAYLLARAIGFLSLLTPAGIGVREAVIVTLLGPYLPAASAAALGLLARCLSMLGEALAVAGASVLAVACRGRAPLSREASS